jgi:hygromycin-B 7''-O-kinase
MPYVVWPPAATAAQFAAVRWDEARLRPSVLALCGHLGLRWAEITRFGTGSFPVYSVGDELVLKLYPPTHRMRATVEEAVLRAVAGRLPVPTPGVEQAGTVDGWSYVLMTRLHGEPLTDIWSRTDERDRDRLATQIGTALAALHEFSLPAIGPENWNQFIAEQRLGCVARQRSRGLGEPWLAQVPAFLDSVRLDSSRPVLLHTEIMREHLLATAGPHGSWSLSGLYDFEPAMMGAREYEFALAGIYVSAGESRVLRHLLTAYGYSYSELDSDLQRRLLAYALLHRYSNLPKYLNKLPAPRMRTLDAVAERWWRWACR